MFKTYFTERGLLLITTACICYLIVFLFTSNNALSQTEQFSVRDLPRTPSPSSTINLKDIPFKIVHETYCTTEGIENWEIFIMNADGSEHVNLTKTPRLDEMYPHASPDGSKICFTVDEGTNRRNKVRSVYYMNIDGSDRVLVERNARQACWSPDGKKIAYLKGEYESYNAREYATSELFIYDMETGQHTPHPNKNLHHLYAICWAPNGKWIMGVIEGNSEYSDTILAIEADGQGVFDLEKFGVKGCRPDLRFDGKMVTWGETDWDLNMADIDLSSDEPVVSNIKRIVKCLRSAKIYHVDFSPDGKYIAFSYGPSAGGQQVGGMAEGWDICVTDLSGNWVKITRDGNHNKEPDWVPIPDMSESEESAQPASLPSVLMPSVSVGNQ